MWCITETEKEMSEPSYSRWVKSNHDDESECCECVTCTENAAWDYYDGLRHG